jgi:hypothetical protein
LLTARSIIEVPSLSLELTGQAQLCLGKRTGKSLAAILASGVTRPASPGRYLAERLQMPIAICCCQDWPIIASSLL